MNQKALDQELMHVMILSAMIVLQVEEESAQRNLRREQAVMLVGCCLFWSVLTSPVVGPCIGLAFVHFIPVEESMTDDETCQKITSGHAITKLHKQSL